MRYTLATAAAIILVGVQHANATAMLCKNPSREYAASYSEDSKRFLVDDTQYTVKAVENNSARYVVSGHTVGDGPDFRAEFRPHKRIEFFVNDQLFQTDRCR